MLQRIVFALLLLLCGSSTFVHHFAAAHEYAAFADFLRWQRLQHAIVAATNSTAALNDVALRALLREFHVRFFNVATSRIAFTDSCCYPYSPRVGIYLAPLENVSLQRHVLLSATDADDNGDIFNNTQAWFIVSAARGKEEAHANVQRIMTQLPLNISADITLAVRGENNSLLQLFDIYKLQSDRVEIIEKGYWHKEMGLKIDSYFQKTFVRRRRDFRQLVLRTGTVIIEKPAGIDLITYLLNNKDNKTLDIMQRKMYQMMMYMKEMFNLTYQLTAFDSWGILDDNGSWTGVVGSMVRHENEFALCPIRLVAARVGYITYLSAIHTEYIFFLLRHPRRNVIRNIFVEPFADTVWFSILALIAAATLLLAVYLQHERRLRLQSTHAEHSFDYVLLAVLKAVLMQGPSPSDFNATSTRLHVVCLCVFSVLLLQFYSAFIVGSLLALPPRTLTTIEALYNSSLEIGMENIPYNFDIFMNVKNPLARAIYTQRICKDRSRNILSIEEGAVRIQRGNFAFHVSTNRMYVILKDLLTEAEFCDLQVITFSPAAQTVLATHKNSPLREYLAQTNLLFRTTGLLQYHDKQWQTPTMDCRLSQSNEVEVDLEHFIPALVLLTAAMLLSVAILLLELLIDAVKRKWPQARTSDVRVQKMLQQRQGKAKKTGKKVINLQYLE